MEGPSIFLAAEQLAPFVGEVIQAVGGNTKIEKKRLQNKRILSLVSFGKQLFFQFDDFALRVHFLLFGSFEATVNGKMVTGDYPKKVRVPRLSLVLPSGHVELYSCSVLFVENNNVAKSCDFTIDIMSKQWEGKKAFFKLKSYPKSEICDVLLDQTIFAGVGNIIKNEVLLLAKVSPLRTVESLSDFKLKQIIKLTHQYVFQFYEWRKSFVLRKHYQVYRQSICKQCGTQVMRKKNGFTEKNKLHLS